MKDILTEIIASKRLLLQKQKEIVTPDQLQENLENITPAISMRAALAGSATGIIAEFKRRSPSKGWINEHASAALIPEQYKKSGATALSILTDEPYFGGSLKDLRTARGLVDIPILRKDFIIDEYQLLQAKIVGADAVLLIAAALTEEECLNLARKAHELQLEVLLEIHSRSELPYVSEHVDIVGVNNRNLGTFHTDIENSFRLAEQLPKEKLLVSESGISSPETIIRLREAGFRGFLIGETFMKTNNPGHALQEMINGISQSLS